MKTIGIIGGMSYESSIHYYERINNQVNELAGDLTCARMIIYNVNFEEIRKLMLSNEWDKIGEELARIAKVLETAGADYIAIATNTMHKLANYVQNKINIPLIHIADCVADKCKKSDIYNVGLLGTKYTMVEDFLVDRLKENKLTVTVPKNEKDINEIDRIILEKWSELRDIFLNQINNNYSNNIDFNNNKNNNKIDNYNYKNNRNVMKLNYDMGEDKLIGGANYTIETDITNNIFDNKSFF